MVTSFDEVAGGRKKWLHTRNTFVILAISFSHTLSRTHTHYTLACKAVSTVVHLPLSSAAYMFYIPTRVFLPFAYPSTVSIPLISIADHFQPPTPPPTPLQTFRCYPQPLQGLFCVLSLLPHPFSLLFHFPQDCSFSVTPSTLSILFSPSLFSIPSSLFHLPISPSVIGKGFCFFCQQLSLFRIVSTPPNSSLAFSLCLSLSLSSVRSPHPPGYCCFYLTVNASHNPMLPPPLAAVFLLIYISVSAAFAHQPCALSLSQSYSLYQAAAKIISSP